MGQLVGPGQLASYLQHSTRPDSEELAIRIAEGWLASVTTQLPVWPQPPPEDLWSWALELAALAYSNPTSMTSRTTDEDTRTWSAERRIEILAAAADRYGDGRGSASTTGGPQGDFPIALDWPDPPVIGWPAMTE